MIDPRIFEAMNKLRATVERARFAMQQRHAQLMETQFRVLQADFFDGADPSPDAKAVANDLFRRLRA